MMFRNRLFLRVTLLLVLLMLPVFVQAQTATQLLINYPELAEEGDGLRLGVYFNVTDTSGRVLTDAEISSARILLDDGSGYDATVERPTSPIYITLVLDASGTMASAAQPMREAAINAVNSAPEEALFSVVRFNDEVSVLTDFTNDRNRVINAIGEVQPRNLAGTCLFDATYRSVELMQQVPAGRRAIILFTDGQRDEKADGSVCSTHVLTEVIDLANRPESRVPIHTIGLTRAGTPLMVAELQDMAATTGGLSVIGEQAELSSLFQQIIDALKSQWLASALIYPTAGQHTAQVLATLGDGSFPQPAVAVFIAQRDYRQTPTITPTQPTETPTIVTVAVDSISYDAAAETISIQALVANEELVSEYRFEFKDENNLVQAEFVLPAPMPETATFPSRTLRDGEVTVVLTGLDADRRIVARGEPVTFTYQGPTATPQPPTNTPEPVSATLTGIEYDEAQDIITLNVSVLGQAQIENLEINVVNGDTNLLERRYSFEPEPRIDLPTDELQPGQDYVINVIAQGANGQILSQSESEFTYTPILTPTPTPVLVEISFGIEPNADMSELVFRIDRTNERMIDRYELRLVDGESNTLVKRFEFQTPPFDAISVPITEIPGGQYEITLNAYNAQNELLDSAVLEARITPPTPTPTATPLSGLQALIAQARSNPIIVVVIGAIMVALILLLFMLLRQPKRAKTGTAFLQEMTSVQPVPQAPAPSARSAPEHKPGVEATNVVPSFGANPDATNAIPSVSLPHATLLISRTRNPGLNGQQFVVDHIPYSMGRGTRDLSIEGDNDISRNHAEITYADGTFYITDLESRHGTFVDKARLTPRTPTPLNRGSKITLGTTTVLVFEADEPLGSSGFDPDKTSY